jgi:hypothetical protein
VTEPATRTDVPQALVDSVDFYIISVFCIFNFAAPLQLKFRFRTKPSGVKAREDAMNDIGEFGCSGDLIPDPGRISGCTPDE